MKFFFTFYFSGECVLYISFGTLTYFNTRAISSWNEFGDKFLVKPHVAGVFSLWRAHFLAWTVILISTCVHAGRKYIVMMRQRHLARRHLTLRNWERLYKDGTYGLVMQDLHKWQEEIFMKILSEFRESVRITLEWNKKKVILLFHGCTCSFVAHRRLEDNSCRRQSQSKKKFACEIVPRIR